MTLDYKKEYKNLYLPKEEPELVRVPAMKFFAMEGSGDPNEEGLCVQIMHRGSFDDEPRTVLKLENFLKESSYRNDIGALRRHHEIYLSDPRKSEPEKMKTVIRHPIAEK